MISFFFIYIFKGSLGRRETFNSGVFYVLLKSRHHWKDLQLEQSYGELRVPLLSKCKTIPGMYEGLRLLLSVVSFWIFFAWLLDRQLVANTTVKKTKCRLFIVSPRYWQKCPNRPYIMHQSRSGKRSMMSSIRHRVFVAEVHTPDSS